MSEEEIIKNLSLDGQPFENLRVCYFKVYDDRHEKIFLDATDEQILSFITKIHETAHIIKIEEVKVLEVTTHIPAKKKLDSHELKHGMSNKERIDSIERAKSFSEKYK